MKERIIMDFKVKYDFFYEKISDFEWYSNESVRKAVFNKTKISSIAPYYNLPTSGTFNFTGIIFKKQENDEHVTLLEAIQNNKPYYYPISELLARFFRGALSEAEYFEFRSTNLKGCSIIRVNAKALLSDFEYYQLSQPNGTIDFLELLFNNKWTAELITGYVNNFDRISAVDINQRAKTDWRSNEFVIEKHFYIIRSKN